MKKNLKTWWGLWLERMTRAEKLMYVHPELMRL